MTNAHNNLHGQQKLEEAQRNANREIDNLSNLTSAQKSAEKALINSKQTRTEVQNQLNDAKALNGSMGTLKELVNKQSEVQGTSNYINEDGPEKMRITMQFQQGKQSLIKRLIQYSIRLLLMKQLIILVLKSQHFTVNKNYKQLKQMQQTQLTHCQISIHRKKIL